MKFGEMEWSKAKASVGPGLSSGRVFAAKTDKRRLPSKYTPRDHIDMLEYPDGE